MDPVTQAVAGGLLAHVAARGKYLRPAFAVGAIAGMAPDLDVLIRSSSDTLMAIEYHRHFSHSFSFVPVIGISVALLAWPWLRRSYPRLLFAQVFCWALLGALSHGVLDAATSYGTRLLWPLSDTRVAWNVISVIDPMFTLPVAFFLLLAVWRRRITFSAVAGFWAVGYLAFAVTQQTRAEAIVMDWAQRESIEVQRLLVKPSFANLVVWRGLIDDGERFHSVAVRTLPGAQDQLWPGATVLRYQPASVEPASRRADDLRRFAHFSSNWQFHYPPMDSGQRIFIGDFRYAIDPAGDRPLWGILLEPGKLSDPVRFQRSRDLPDEERTMFMGRLFGDESAD